jgi:dolichol-phosphate mannosyltransferase
MPFEVQTLAEWERTGAPDMLSVVIPAHDEAENLESSLREIERALSAEGIRHELLVVEDGSQDDTLDLLAKLSSEMPALRYFSNEAPHGYGFAVRAGLARFRGDAVAIVMADGSDDPADIVRFYRKLQEGYDCVFGSRFVRGATVVDYPWQKLILNRIGNNFIRLLFVMRYNDVSNAFKMFRRRVIAGIQPLLSHHFNLTIELPLKAIARGYTYAVVPNNWRNRAHGVSKFVIKEMGSRYLFIILYCLVEKLLSKGDYHREREHRSRQLQVWPK